MITLENGKLISAARGDAASAATIIRYFAGAVVGFEPHQADVQAVLPTQA